MPGPLPKDPAIRARQNKPSTHAKLSAESGNSRRVPPLPKVDGVEWNKLTRQWWRDVWRSPMATQFLESDGQAVLRLARLVNDFWQKPNPKLAGEIRLEQAMFGLTPLDRRRLDWRIEPGEAEEVPAEKPSAAEDSDDPRRHLRVV